MAIIRGLGLGKRGARGLSCAADEQTIDFSLPFTMMEYKEQFPFDWADADRAYHNYVENCRRQGVAPMSWEMAKEQMKKWSDALAAGRPPSQTKQ